MNPNPSRPLLMLNPDIYHEAASPLIKHDPDIGWEVFVPEDNLPTTLRCVSLSPEGLYVETTDGAWDLIALEDMAELVEPVPHIPDDPMEFEITNRSRLITKLLPYVQVAAGQPEPVVSGQERMRRRLDPEWQ